MSFMVIECPWCGETYTFGFVGVQQIGSGHECRAVVDCVEEGCQNPGTFLIDQDGAQVISCSDHIGDAIVVACQPGRPPLWGLCGGSPADV